MIIGTRENKNIERAICAFRHFSCVAGSQQSKRAKRNVSRIPGEAVLTGNMLFKEIGFPAEEVFAGNLHSKIPKIPGEAVPTGKFQCRPSKNYRWGPRRDHLRRRPPDCAVFFPHQLKII